MEKPGRVAEESSIGVLLVDDHEVVREGLRAMLSRYPDIDVVGEAEDGSAALRLSKSLDPDVILLDLRMGDTQGMDVIREVSQSESEKPRLLVLTVHDDDEIVLEAVRGGAHGYVLKDATREELVSAIRRVAAGGEYFDSVVVRALMKGEQKSERTDSLSDRELDVLRLLASGFTNKEIAEQLFVSSDTVKTHLASIYRKLSVSDRTHAVAVALRQGLLT